MPVTIAAPALVPVLVLAAGASVHVPVLAALVRLSQLSSRLLHAQLSEFLVHERPSQWIVYYCKLDLPVQIHCHQILLDIVSLL